MSTLLVEQETRLRTTMLKEFRDVIREELREHDETLAERLAERILPRILPRQEVTVR